VRFLKKRLKPIAALDAKRVQQLLTDLDDSQFTVREAASKELKELGKAVEPVLRKALAASPSAEVRKRLEELCAGVRDTKLTPEMLRQMRAIQVLERIGSTEAQEFLAVLAEGPPWARPAQDARAASERLKRRLTNH
jgi:hypothetical protein